MNLEEIRYKKIEITGELLYVDIPRYTGWAFLTNDTETTLDIVFDGEVDLTALESGTTITIIGD